MTKITTNTIATTTPPIPPAIWPILLVWGSCGGVVLLLSYLIKKTRITTNTIATTTPPILPAIGPILLVWGSCWEDCTTTILLDKDGKDHYQHYSHYYTTNTSSHRTNITCLRLLWWGIVLQLSYLIKMTKITTNTIATTTPPLPPAIGPILLVWCSSGWGCTTIILPDKDGTDYYQHYSHYYTTNTSCYRTNITCLRILWRGLYYYYLTW